MYGNKTIIQFSNELSSSSPTPGGGGAAAAVAALGVALSSMAFNLTIGKKQYNEYDENIKQLIINGLNKADILRNEFIQFIDKDAEAFIKVIEAFKLPKETKEQIKIRKEKIDESYENAALVPLQLALKAKEVYDIIEIACKYGNRNVITDAGAAAILINSVIETAVLNININLSGIKNVDYKNSLIRDSKNLTDESDKRKKEIMLLVNEVMGA
jgi:formiminotetrahydrofolate cyclodeaminase